MSVEPAAGPGLIKSSDVIGADVFDGGGHKIASVRELFLDPASGQVQFAILQIATLLGGGGKYHPVPWSGLLWDAGRAGYVASFDKDRLKAAPSYDREQINSSAYGWDAQVHSYYAL